MLHTIYACAKPSSRVCRATPMRAAWASWRPRISRSPPTARSSACPRRGSACCPATIAPYVIRAIGERAARRYVVSAERFDAAEALRLGLVHQVSPAEALDAAVGAVAQAIASNGPPRRRRMQTAGPRGRRPRDRTGAVARHGRAHRARARLGRRPGGYREFSGQAQPAVGAGIRSIPPLTEAGALDPSMPDCIARTFSLEFSD